MAIRNPVLFGLKVSFSLTDVESKNTALNSLGLDVRDLAVIEGISGNLRTEELQNVSGLDVNLTRYLDRLKSDSNRYVGLINLISGYLTPTRGNLEAYGAVSGGAMRFQFVPNDKGDNVTKNDVKYGDISTSRVSAWSGGSEGDPTSAISYGASVQVRGTLKLGNSPAYSVPTNQSILNVIDTPEPVRFDTEVPTDIIKMDLNGTDGYLYAMRGIPQIFTTAFKNIAMDFTFTPYPVNGVNKTPIYTLTDTDSGYEIVSRPSATTLSRLRYNTTSFKERQIRVYFPPANITAITGNNINLTTFPVVKYPSATSFTFANNLLTEMPDWTTINYVQTYNTQDPPQITSESATLRNVNLQNNYLYQSGIDEEKQFGSKLLKKFPKTLRSLNLRACYNGHTEFLNQEEMMALRVTQSEYNNVIIDRDNKQEFTFAIGSTSQPVVIKGKYFDKHFFDDVYYVYIDEPTSTTVITGIPNYWETIDVLDLSTRCPELRDFNVQDLSGRRLFRTSASRIVDKTSTVPGVRNISYTTNQEETPRVNIKEIRTYNIYNCYFTRISPVFEDPVNVGGLEAGESSQLRTFQVGENEALTSDGLNFTRMSFISSISLYDTALPLPTGLENKTTLSSLNCNYTRFPTRSPAPVAWTPSGSAAGGNPIAQNNTLWSTSEPTSLGNYALNGCSNLRSLNFYASYLDGMIPKFLGNGQLRTIDFRYSRIEGGRPGGIGASFNGGEHGRRYIMWDDTFEEAQRISTIRIISSYLGRNIGTWNGSTYTGAEFEAATFNLPSLSYLQIQSTGGYLTGNFFSTSGAPNLRYIISENNGWGSGTSTGNTPLPSFGANSRIYYIALRNNKFNGTIELVNLTNLRYFYVSSNEIQSVGNLQNLSRLNYFIVGNNQISSAFPDFSNGAPNIQYISMNNNQMTVFGEGTLAGATRLRSLDVSNNLFNSANIDAILEDLLANYNAARRSGVIVNLSGNTGQPSSNSVTTPTSTTTKEGEETITVTQTDPANPTATFAATTLNLRNDSPNSTTTYFTKLFINGSEVSLPNASVSINYSNDSITFAAGSEPTSGTEIKLEVWKTVTGSVTTVTGGIVIVNELRAKGWTINF
jgi:hypothetical protein